MRRLRLTGVVKRPSLNDTLNLYYANPLNKTVNLSLGAIVGGVAYFGTGSGKDAVAAFTSMIVLNTYFIPAAIHGITSAYHNYHAKKG